MPWVDFQQFNYCYRIQVFKDIYSKTLNDCVWNGNIFLACQKFMHEIGLLCCEKFVE